VSIQTANANNTVAISEYKSTDFCNTTEDLINCMYMQLKKQTATVQARRLSLFGHIARMSDESNAKQILTASPLENWRRLPSPGCPHTTWMKTTQLKSINLFLN